ncbi:MAG: nucleotidyl transferase AbiEii/AbiGii toxin family protein [Planctomycetes bacterium]|nr:nucleotidyl transferase AbiEii/AbiGii toxin family protein [Planctomycetota bacterium]
MAKRKNRQIGDADDWVHQVKRRAVIALFSDDELLHQLVLKGGNALELVHRITTRASLDLDFSMESAFEASQLDDLRARIEYRLRQSFQVLNLVPFDVTLVERPDHVTDDLREFWGGYALEFKVIGAEEHAQLSGNHEQLQRNAIRFGGPRGSSRFEADISKYEYCEGKESHELDGFTIYAYSPAMVVAEKLRAICQQTPEYADMVRKKRSLRGRDFLDIHDLVVRFNLRADAPDAQRLVRRVFAAKRVPLALIATMGGTREFHRQDWPQVEATIRPDVVLKEFDYYFDFVLKWSGPLQALRDE